MQFADSLAFLGLPGRAIEAPGNLRLSIAHVTSVPPLVCTMDGALQAHSTFVAEINAQPHLQFVQNGSELDRALESGKTAVICGLQNLPPVADLAELRKAGISFAGIAYQGINNYGSGWLNAGVGLTVRGRGAIEELLALGIVLDLSHAGHQTARDALSLNPFCGKVAATHGGCYSKYHHMRNLPDDVLIRIASLGGIVGIATRTFTLDELAPGILPFLRHLRHAINICGEDAVCIGSDAAYVNISGEAWYSAHLELAAKLDPLGTLGMRYPEHPKFLNGADRMEILCSMLKEIRVSPIPVRVIEKIFWKNFLNFFERE